jgi:glycosyltransferase involved in cell wall biosynthesis
MISLAIYLWIHRKQYDLIHVHQALYPAFISIFIGKKLLRKPVIVKTASSGITSDIVQLRKFPSGHFQLAYLLKNMGCLVTVSKVGGQEYRRIGFPDSRIEYIPNGVNLSKENERNYARVVQVVTTARLSPEKGIDILIKAWVDVVKEEKSLKLIILGDGPLLEELKRLSDFLGVKESVEFMGMVQNVEFFLKKTDIFVLPSRTEGLSNALLEAMSKGMPCIATNVGGNIDIMKDNGDANVKKGEIAIGRNGVLVNSDDPEGLSKAILFLVRNPKERETLALQGKKMVEKNYSLDAVADKYISLYQRMIGGKS